MTRIMYVGMNGIFSVAPLQALLAADHAPVALVVPPPPGVRFQFGRLRYPASGEGENIFTLAARNAIPMYEIGDLQHPEALSLLARLEPDIIVVACFPKIFPDQWLKAPRLGCINLHPSLLPAYRGPSPLEEQLSNGETMTGITLHFMDQTADTGDIIVQEMLAVPKGASLDQLNRLTSAAGARLLVEVLRTPEDIPRQPQG